MGQGLRISVLTGVSAVLALLAGLSLDGLAEHKLCEGMTLKRPPDAGYSVSFNPENGLLHLKGPLEVGACATVEKALAEHPQSTGIILDSEGGNIYQGRGLAKIILEHNLSTYTFDRCYSACTLAYTAGRVRYLGTGAKLGFHAYRVDSGLMQPLIDVAQEQARDLAYFRERLPDTAFIDKIFLHRYPEIWMPDAATLMQAGVVHVILTGPP